MKLSYEEVKKRFEESGCQLVSETYEGIRVPVTYIARCGHERTSNFDAFQRSKQKLCYACAAEMKNHNLDNFNKSRDYFSYAKVKERMEKLYEQTHKYRDDFKDENYDQTFTCWDCKQEKNRKLFPYSKAYKYQKEKRCKKCKRIDSAIRRQNWSGEQFINELINSCKASCIKRHKKGRSECVEFNIDTDYILELLEKQDNKCVLSGRVMVPKINDKNKLSIDRIDSDKGYTKDNIQLVCWMVNQAKSNFSDDEFIEMCKNVYLNNKVE